ncbi:MAG: signal peptidase I [Coriobacteriales bacterium]|jgi:signal peptidase I|nr:signal peptidase I [Coriobacteriales bacterium]
MMMRRSTRKMLFAGIRDALIAVALLALLLQFFAPMVVIGHSMQPGIQDNDILYIARRAYWFSEPQYGDLVVFDVQTKDESGQVVKEKNLVKRVIGLPGDTISVKNGKVYRNGEALNEPYLMSGTTPGTMAALTVPADTIFVLGDNREVSNDSRNPALGPIAQSSLKGKIIFRMFPLDHIGSVS